MVDLYALPPEEFTAARDAAAKVDKALKTVRRPAVSAWVLNTLVRRDVARLDALTELGAELLTAQRAGDGAALRELGPRRRELVEQVTDEALALAGRQVSPAVRGEVAATLDAAVADEASAVAVRSGRLVRALSFAGFGGVNLDGAVASAPARSPSSRPAPGSARARVDRLSVAELERAAHEASGQLDDAVRRAEQTGGRLEDADRADEATRAAHDQAAQLVDAAQMAVRDAELAEATARAALVEAERTSLSASQAKVEAQRVHGRAATARTRTERALAEAQQVAGTAVDAVAAAQQATVRARQALDARRR